MDKEQAAADFLEMIRGSWTYERLTEDEASQLERFLEELASPDGERAVRGSYKDRWRELNNVYHAFLLGCGMRGGKFRD